MKTERNWSDRTGAKRPFWKKGAIIHHLKVVHYRKKLADDFGISYDSKQKPSVRPKIREPIPEQKYYQEENHCYKMLTDYFHLLREWKQQYAPKQPEEEWHPLFVEALQRESYIEYSPVWHSRRKESTCS